MNRIIHVFFALILIGTTLNAQDYQQVSVSSINLKGQADSYPYLSHDGLRLYFTRENADKTTLYLCTREKVSQEFTHAEVIDTGLPQNAYSLWMNKEETKIFFIAESDKLYIGKRKDTVSMFSANQFERIELKNFKRDYIAQPSFTPDENELYLYASSDNREIVSFRKTGEYEYTLVKCFSDNDFGGMEVAPGQLSKDGLRFYFSLKNNSDTIGELESGNQVLHQLAFLERENLNKPFEEATFLESSFQNRGIDNFQPTISADNKTLLWVVTVANSWASNDFRMASTEQVDASIVTVDYATLDVQEDCVLPFEPILMEEENVPEIQSLVADPSDEQELNAQDPETILEVPVSQFLIPNASEKNVAESYPWISDDGLRLYYTRGNTIYFAQRGNIGSDFINPVALDNNLFDNVTSCWLSPDELSIYYVTGASTLNVAKRNSTNENFAFIQAITFINKPEGNLFGPSFTPEMEELWMYNYNGTEQIVSFRKTSRYEYTYTGVVDFKTTGEPTAGQFSRDGLSYCVPLRLADDKEMKQLYVVTRESLRSQFSTVRLVETTKPIDITAYQPSISANGKCLIFVTGSKNQWSNNNLCEAEIVTDSKFYQAPSTEASTQVVTEEASTEVDLAIIATAVPFQVTAAPNPFSTQTTLSFLLPDNNAVKISLIDITGKIVFESDIQNMKQGRHEYSIDRKNLAAGIYYAIIESGSDKRFVKLVIR